MTVTDTKARVKTLSKEDFIAKMASFGVPEFMAQEIFEQQQCITEYAPHTPAMIDAGFADMSKVCLVLRRPSVF